ncbi:unnamed protein product [Ambrosiozyma monospora]|uniref:Unnamed protein product n=1 Tax=Ambrosiozyma monospora TaxID=43982 RepID=A0A9W6YV19_AMBMO|nr:unnamed protein product [Ambrosiozyma monospora]
MDFVVFLFVFKFLVQLENSIKQQSYKKPAKLFQDELIYADAVKHKENNSQFVTSTQPLATILSKDSFLCLEGDSLGLYSPWQITSQYGQMKGPRPDTIDLDLVTYLKAKHAFELPNLKDHVRLVKLFLDNLYPLYPVVDRKLLQQDDGDRKLRVVAEELYNRCKLLSLLETAKVTLMQSYLLMPTHEEGSEGGNNSRQFVSKASMICAELSIPVMDASNFGSNTSTAQDDPTSVSDDTTSMTDKKFTQFYSRRYGLCNILFLRFKVDFVAFLDNGTNEKYVESEKYPISSNKMYYINKFNKLILESIKTDPPHPCPLPVVHGIVHAMVLINLELQSKRYSSILNTTIPTDTTDEGPKASSKSTRFKSISSNTQQQQQSQEEKAIEKDMAVKQTQFSNCLRNRNCKPTTKSNIKVTEPNSSNKGIPTVQDPNHNPHPSHFYSIQHNSSSTSLRNGNGNNFMRHTSSSFIPPQFQMSPSGTNCDHTDYGPFSANEEGENVVVGQPLENQNGEGVTGNTDLSYNRISELLNWGSISSTQELLSSMYEEGGFFLDLENS